ncbi:hypothetical protein EYF80_019608 [Liparis tanakae]|uniref:Uncharacterized protein n=1 Tax=Liparis tanakae TaxID=230148 RepID=A0A4Z2HWQ9_9TELE|nr:hypothetical protein EYF80_019608 [Liparis tanakae]
MWPQITGLERARASADGARAYYLTSSSPPTIQAENAVAVTSLPYSYLVVDAPELPGPACVVEERSELSAWYDGVTVVILWRFIEYIRKKCFTFSATWGGTTTTRLFQVVSDWHQQYLSSTLAEPSTSNPPGFPRAHRPSWANRPLALLHVSSEEFSLAM